MFQSALLREERCRLCRGCCSRVAGFNPRSYVRSDAGVGTVIRSPREFQSALLREERWVAQPHTLSAGVFQSALLREERYEFSRLPLQLSPGFNPRSYVRSDAAAYVAWWAATLFQSALLREERWGCALAGEFKMRFQSALLREERFPDINCITRRPAFQSALLREERSSQHRRSPNSWRFQSALLREERYKYDLRSNIVFAVSIRAPT